mmetsp:Transcript_9453/g.25135  ORF Transcript_9453/g.25135 Transcript_9453/m.25135 type:complete len:581 (+) Transcript_9453:7-1749(+)
MGGPSSNFELPTSPSPASVPSRRQQLVHADLLHQGLRLLPVEAVSLRLHGPPGRVPYDLQEVCEEAFVNRSEGVTGAAIRLGLLVEGALEARLGVRSYALLDQLQHADGVLAVVRRLGQQRSAQHVGLPLAARGANAVGLLVHVRRREYRVEVEDLLFAQASPGDANLDRAPGQVPAPRDRGRPRAFRVGAQPLRPCGGGEQLLGLGRIEQQPHQRHAEETGHTGLHDHLEIGQVPCLVDRSRDGEAVARAALELPAGLAAAVHVDDARGGGAEELEALRLRGGYGGLLPAAGAWLVWRPARALRMGRRAARRVTGRAGTGGLLPRPRLRAGRGRLLRLLRPLRHAQRRGRDLQRAEDGAPGRRLERQHQQRSAPAERQGIEARELRRLESCAGAAMTVSVHRDLAREVEHVRLPVGLQGRVRVGVARSSSIRRGVLQRHHAPAQPRVRDEQSDREGGRRAACVHDLGRALQHVPQQPFGHAGRAPQRQRRSHGVGEAGPTARLPGAPGRTGLRRAAAAAGRLRRQRERWHLVRPSALSTSAGGRGGRRGAVMGVARLRVRQRRLAHLRQHGRQPFLRPR